MSDTLGRGSRETQQQTLVLHTFGSRIECAGSFAALQMYSACAYLPYTWVTCLLIMLRVGQCDVLLRLCRQAAFNVAIAGWIPCGVIFACIALFLAKEEDALQVTHLNPHTPNTVLCCEHCLKRFSSRPFSQPMK